MDDKQKPVTVSEPKIDTPVEEDKTNANVQEKTNPTNTKSESNNDTQEIDQTNTKESDKSNLEENTTTTIQDTESKENSETIIQTNTNEPISESKNETNQTADETNNDIDLVIKPEQPDEPVNKVTPVFPSKSNSFTFLNVISFLFFGTIAVCFMLSCYYRLHLLKNKRAPFNAPKGLKPLFPSPVNYEYEITQLCDKYLAQ